MGRILQGRRFEDLSTLEKLQVIYSERGKDWRAEEIARRTVNNKGND
jgi:hypothetical protein